MTNLTKEIQTNTKITLLKINNHLNQSIKKIKIDMYEDNFILNCLYKILNFIDNLIK